MSAPVKFPTVPSKTLAASMNSTAYTMQISDILGWDAVALTATDFGTELWVVFRDATNTFMEIMQVDPTTIANQSITILKRGLDFYGGSTEIDANKLTWIKNDTIIELGSNPPQLLKAITDYIDSIAIAGAPNASSILQGLVQIPTAAQINAGNAIGSTTAPLAITPDQLALSVYGTQLAPMNGVVFLNAVTGMVFEYSGSTAPTGFLMADGSSYNHETQTALALIHVGRFGYGTGQTFTVNASTDVVTANSHGFSNGYHVLVDSTVTLPGGLSKQVIYYVINVTTNTFQLSTTSGGSAVNITDTGTGTHTVYNNSLLPNRCGRTAIGSGTGTKVATIASILGNVFTVTGLTNAANNEFITGQPVVFTATTAGNLVNATTYYVVKVTATTFSVSTTLANAQNGTVITLLGTEAGTFTISLTARTFATTGGEENHAMSSSEILAHTHALGGVGGSGNHVALTTNINPGSGDTTTSVGGNNPMNNMSPFLVMNFIIKT